ncbi:MAG: Gfo/Idh/MocA family protein [Solirubrobacteraceae bacterium]
MRFGLLSTAAINDKLLAGARLTEAAEIVAVASRDKAKAFAYARERGIERSYGSYEALLADDGIEAVYVSLPNSMHVEWSVRALQAGKHVLCEKPLTRHAEQAARAFDVAEQAGLILMEAFMWRYTPQAGRLLELLTEIGELRLIRAHFSFAAVNPGNVRLDPALDGGALMDVGCYPVSAVRLIAGAEPESVTGAQRVADTGVDIAFAGTLSFPDGVLAHFDCGMDMGQGSRHEIEVVGSRATLRLADPFHSRSPRIELDGRSMEVEFRDPYTCELEAFVSGQPRFGRDDAIGQARTIEALYASVA